MFHLHHLQRFTINNGDTLGYPSVYMDTTSIRLAVWRCVSQSIGLEASRKKGYPSFQAIRRVSFGHLIWLVGQGHPSEKYESQLG